MYEKTVKNGPDPGLVLQKMVNIVILKVIKIFV